MKDIFKLTFKDKSFKVKMFLYSLLIAIIELAAITFPVMLIDSGNDVASVIGLMLFFFALLAVMIFAYKIIINKMIGTYYPQIKVDSNEVVMKVLALVTIFYPLVVIAYLIGLMLAIVSLSTQSVVLGLVLVAVGIVLTYQVAALTLSVIYIILDLIENNVRGYRCVFNQLGIKLSRIRKYSGQIIIRTVVYSFIASIIVSIGALIIFSILIAIGNSAGAYIFSLFVVYLVSVLLFGWIGLNSYHFMIVRYHNVKKKLNS